MAGLHEVNTKMLSFLIHSSMKSLLCPRSRAVLGTGSTGLKGTWLRTDDATVAFIVRWMVHRVAASGFTHREMLGYGRLVGDVYGLEPGPCDLPGETAEACPPGDLPEDIPASTVSVPRGDDADGAGLPSCRPDGRVLSTSSSAPCCGATSERCAWSARWAYSWAYPARPSAGCKLVTAANACCC